MRQGRETTVLLLPCLESTIGGPLVRMAWTIGRPDRNLRADAVGDAVTRPRPAGVPRLGGRHRLAAALLISAATLLVSLLPPVDVPLDATRPPDVAARLSPIYAGSGVQQSIGRPPTAISRARIWVAAGLQGGSVRVNAAIVAGPESLQLRQFTFTAQPAARPLAQDVEFQPYELPAEDLRLQLSVDPSSENFVSFGVAALEEGRQFYQPTLNGEPLSFLGPVAYSIAGRASGIRAAIWTSGPERLRLAFAIGALVMAAVMAAYGARIGPVLERLLRSRDAEPFPQPGRRLHAYPWFIAAYPVVVFYSVNLESFQLRELVAVLAVVSSGVFVLAAVLYLLWRDAGHAASVTTIVAAAMLTYGHLYDALGDAADHAYLLSAFFVAIVVLAVVIRARWIPVRAFANGLNIAGFVLLAIPVVSIAVQASEVASLPQATYEAALDAGQRERAVTLAVASTGTLPDTYYLVFDGYGRQDTLPGFDNEPFLAELEARGFTVWREAFSNYRTTSWSLTSSLNMRYLDDIVEVGSASFQERLLLARQHLLGRILADLGYTYIHIASGFSLTDSSDIADLVVDFAPSGVVFTESTLAQHPSVVGEPALLGRFWRETLQLSALRPFLPPYFNADANAPFDWWHPERTVQQLKFVSDVSMFPGPRFVFMHLVKPHGPYNFDRHGNTAVEIDGFTDAHDPSVPGAYFGQLLHVNRLIIETVDAILLSSKTPPIIVLASDHGASDLEDVDRHKIFAAVLLPGRASDAVGPRITSVNMWRVVLNSIFGLDFELLPDRIYFDFVDGFPSGARPLPKQ